MDYYVYIYLDPRKPGKYEYGDYCFLYKPFYVGKGKGNRYKESNKRTIQFKRTIDKIKRSGFDVIILKLKEKINENESLLMEIQLIKLIGRRNLNNGPLINLTDGGEGVSGYNHSDETKDKLSEINKGKSFHTKESKKKLSEINKGENNYFSILKEDDVKLILMILNTDEYKSRKIKNSIIADKFRVSKDLISKIKNKKLWKYLECDYSDDILLDKLNNFLENIKQNSCDQRFLIGENHWNSKLTDNDVIKIKKYLNDKKLSHREIADKFNVSKQTITAINNNRIWSHINTGD